MFICETSIIILICQKKIGSFGPSPKQYMCAIEFFLMVLNNYFGNNSTYPDNSCILSTLNFKGVNSFRKQCKASIT